MLILARDLTGSFEEEPRWTVSLLRDGHHARRRAISLPGAAGPVRGWDSAAFPARSFPSARHRGSLQPPLLKCRLPYVPFSSPGAGWRCEKLCLGHTVSQGTWEKVLQTARQCPEAHFQLPTIGFPVILIPRLQPCRCTNSTSLVRDHVFLLHLASANANHSSSSPLPSPKQERGATESCCKVPVLQGNCHDMSIHAGRGLGHGSQECFKQTEVMPRSTLVICFLQDRVSVQGTEKQCHIKPFGSGYQLVTRVGGRTKARI